MYASFISYARQLLEETGVHIRFIDVGSRNGILELAEIAEFVDAYGFEPNPVEYEKLVNNKTDALRFGIKSPNYHSINYSPFALSDKIGNCKFHITSGAGASGLLEPNLNRLKEIHWKQKAYKKNLAEDVFTISNVIDVTLTTLDRFAKEKSFNYIDYLKIDVEGAEYEVLNGAVNILSQVGVIKTEIAFFPVWKNQKIFSDVDLLLRRYGFELLRYEISPAQIIFKERTPWDFASTIGMADRYGQYMIGDAIYVNRKITDKKRIIAQAMILLDKNYLDEALFILRKKTDIDAPNLMNLLSKYQGQWRVRLLNKIFKLGRFFARSSSLWK